MPCFSPNLQVLFFFQGNLFLPRELARGFGTSVVGGCVVKGRVPEADAALNCSVPERCSKYASDWSYAATVADDLHRFVLTKI
jgi:hypothetical protein